MRTTPCLSLRIPAQSARNGFLPLGVGLTLAGGRLGDPCESMYVWRGPAFPSFPDVEEQCCPNPATLSLRAASAGGLGVRSQSSTWELGSSPYGSHTGWGAINPEKRLLWYKCYLPANCPYGSILQCSYYRINKYLIIMPIIINMCRAVYKSVSAYTWCYLVLTTILQSLYYDVSL